VPVRIIFRGLMLFQIPDSGPNENKLVAYPINKPTLPGVSKPNEHAHFHQTEVQILTGAEKGTDLLTKVLKPRATLDIIVPGPKGVLPRRSFGDHIPDLAMVIENATPAIRRAPKSDPDTTLIQNVITVDGGIVRAKNLTMWDQGGYPLDGDRKAIGVQADSLAVLRFVGSTVGGHVATDVVVEIEDGESVELKCDHDDRFRGTRKASASPSDPHMPPGTVEILVSNYEPPTEKPIPWGLDFQWLFEAAGYAAANLESGDSGFEQWVDAAKAYDERLFAEDWKMFFDGPDGPMGRPFPYIQNADALSQLTRLQPLNRPFSIPTCKAAILAASEKVSYTVTKVTITETRITAPDGTVTEMKKIESALQQPTVAKSPAKKAAKKSGAKKAPPKKKKRSR